MQYLQKVVQGRKTGVRLMGAQASFFLDLVDGCVCVVYLGNRWQQDALCRKTGRRRHCYVLDNDLLGNLGSWHSCGCYFDMYCTTDLCRTHGIVADHMMAMVFFFFLFLSPVVLSKLKFPDVSL